MKIMFITPLIYQPLAQKVTSGKYFYASHPRDTTAEKNLHVK